MLGFRMNGSAPTRPWMLSISEIYIFYFHIFSSFLVTSRALIRALACYSADQCFVFDVTKAKASY